MKIRPDSISWFEGGRLLEKNRNRTGKKPIRKAIFAAVAGAVVWAIFVPYTAARHGKPLLSAETVVLLAVAMILPALIVLFQGYMGRSIIVTHDGILRMHVGSKVPKTIKHLDIDHCELRSEVVSGETILVLDVFGCDGKLDEIELSEDAETAKLIEFLKNRGVHVTNAA